MVLVNEQQKLQVAGSISENYGLAIFLAMCCCMYGWTTSKVFYVPVILKPQVTGEFAHNVAVWLRVKYLLGN